MSDVNANPGPRVTPGKLPGPETRGKICSWINDQFELTSLDENPLPTPPVISECSVWSCATVPNPDLLGTTYLAGTTVYYSACVDGQDKWWRVGELPRADADVERES